MKIRRISTNRTFEVSKDEWNTIITNGNSYKYQVMEDDTPLEIKSLRESKEKMELPKKKTIK